MERTRTTTRLASALALIGIVLRVLLPALHSHGSGRGHHAPATESVAVAATVCSCGVVHARSGGGERDGEQADAVPEVHHCLAWAIEEGTPVDRPPQPDVHAPDADPEGSPVRSMRAVAAGSQVRLPEPRAPPDAEPRFVVV